MLRVRACECEYNLCNFLLNSFASFKRDSKCKAAHLHKADEEATKGSSSCRCEMCKMQEHHRTARESHLWSFSTHETKLSMQFIASRWFSQLEINLLPFAFIISSRVVHVVKEVKLQRKIFWMMKSKLGMLDIFSLWTWKPIRHDVIFLIFLRRLQIHFNLLWH